MATTTEKRPQEPLRTVERRSRGLVFTIVVLAIALAAAGAYVLFDLLSEPATQATGEVREVVDEYLAAWEENDSATFLALTTEDYVFVSQGVTFDQAQRAELIEGLGSFRVARTGELVMMGESPEFFLTTAEEISYGGTDHVGISTFRIVETTDGLKIAEHNWTGDF